MKIKVLIIMLFCSVMGWGQNIFFNPITGTNPNTSNPYTIGQTLDPNITVSGIGRGTGITGSNANDRYNATSWNTGSIDTTAYFEFTLTPNAGYAINFNDFIYVGAASGTGPTNVAFRSSLDGYMSNIGTPSIGGTSITLGGAAYQNITTPITFRFYGWGASATAGTYSINIFAFGGTVTLSTPQPEINITQGSTILTGGTHNFGNVNIGSNSDVVFTIQNTGSAALNLTSLPLTTTGDYSIISQPTSPIAALGNSTFTVRFTPTVSGTRTGSVSIANSDTSGSENPYVVNFTGNGTCVPFTFSSFAPASGPVGTEVTITASSGNLTGCTVNFNGTPATIVSATATQIIVTVPSGATTGVINVTKTATGCVSSTSSFTIINQDITSCEGSAISDLIIYEIHDEQSGAGGTITIFNGTGVTKNLSDYRIFRTSNQNDGNEVNYTSLTGSIASGALGIVRVAGTVCSPVATNGSVTGGFNENDGIQLRSSDLVTVIDDVDVFSATAGYYMLRNVGGFIPRTSYVAADWTNQSLIANQCIATLGTTPAFSYGSIPSITTQPSLALTCTSTSATISVVGAEGFSGGLGLAYQWFAISTTGVWTALNNAGVYTGATSATLNISSLTGLNGYQYYCQVLENSATCYVASVAVKINTGATTWNGTAWDNGFPSINNVVIIAGNYNTSNPFPEGSFDACSVTVNSSTTLTISANSYINIENQLTNNGTVTVENNGSLVQINDTPATANTGNITVQRTATGVVAGEDYVYWSAPVIGQTFNGVFSGSSPRYSWETTTTNANGGQGTWVPYTGAMSAGSGYIVRDNSSANFTGVPYNGIFTPAIARGTDFTTPGTQLIPRTATDDNWNLLGNPYPSAISVNRFLDLNPQLEGFINVWTHGQSPTNAVDPFYQNFVLNYFANDYVQYNSTGNNNNPSDFEIASGQGFMALMDAGIAGTSTALFNNSMRNKDYDNSQFFRTANKQNTTKNRIWIDLVSPNESSRTMFGYVPNATNGLDDRYDAFTDLKSNLKFYSILEDKIYGIQGKSLPFINTDFVPVGFKTATNGSHTIALAATDGLFANNGQTIYLEDKLLDVLHNLSLNPYDFTATAGTYNNRFVIRYLDRALSTNDFDLVNNNISVFASSIGIRINSSLNSVKSYVVYNVLGQTLASESNINKNECIVKNMMKSDQALIVKTTLNDGQVLTRKVIY